MLGDEIQNRPRVFPLYRALLILIYVFVSLIIFIYFSSRFIQQIFKTNQHHIYLLLRCFILLINYLDIVCLGKPDIKTSTCKQLTVLDE